MNKLNKIILIAAVLLSPAFTQRCTDSPSGEAALPILQKSPASVMTLNGSDNELYITDYFPALDRADSVTASPGLILTEVLAGRQYVVATSGETPVLNTVQVWYEGKDYGIVARKERPHPDNQHGKPVLLPVSYDKESISLFAGNQPEAVIAVWQNTILPAEMVSSDGSTIRVGIPSCSAQYERSFLRVFAADDSVMFSDVLIPLQNGRVITDADQLTRKDKHAQVMYSLMIDRFYNGDPSNDRRLEGMDVLDQVNYQGGDIAGITQKIRDGFFTELGINTIWISPITQNPEDAWGLYEEPYTKFSGYHGYWPIYSTQVDDRFGTDEEVHEMLEAAHSAGMNVILDYVANHLHIDSPVLKEHPDWTTPLELPDGRRNLELWDEHRLTTWFDLHIPTLDIEREEIYQPMTDSALHWIANFDFDGFRHDATKHIPEVYWRTLTAKINQRFPDKELYQIGETYGSPELINRYVRTGMLDAQFDFNVYDRIIWQLADENGSMNQIAGVLNQSTDVYGYHNLMGYITGNHDRPRFISLAGGSLSFDEDSKHAGWNREITVGDETAYDKLALLHAIIMTIPGVPCIYQGDEYGVPGGNDPDNRRMMQFDGYTAKEQRLRDQLARLIALRRGNMALIYGQYLPLYSDENTLVFARIYMNDVVIAAFNKSAQPRQITVKLPSILDIAGLKPQFGSPFTVEGSDIRFEMSPVSFEIATQ